MEHGEVRLLDAVVLRGIHCTALPRTVCDEIANSAYQTAAATPAASIQRDMRMVFDAIWNNMTITPWERGDIVAIDNNAIGHGRLPFEGPREIVVSWA